MPEEPTKRSATVLALWVSITLVLLGTVVSFVLAISHWDELIAFSNRWGNVASVAGLWLAVVGFLVTILSLWLTHQVEREARKRIAETLSNASDAVTTAQEETRQAILESSQVVTAAQGQMREAVVRIGYELLQSECSALGYAVREIHRLTLEAVTHGESWVKVAERCREAARAATLLLGNPHLNEEETIGLRRGVDDLNDLARFVQRKRIPPGSAQSPLRAVQVEPLEALITLIDRTSMRMRRRVLEIPNANF